MAGSEIHDAPPAAPEVRLEDIIAAAPVRAIFLDAGGVLILPSHDEISSWLEMRGVRLVPDRLDRAHYLALDSLDAASLADGAWRWQVYLHDYVVEAGALAETVPAAMNALEAALASMTLWSRPIADSVAVLPELVALGRPVVVVSNSDGSVERLLATAGACQVGPGPATEVTAIVDSHVVGFAKPDPRIFDTALSAAGVGPAEAIHVGDSRFADVAGAVAAGIRAIHFDPLQRCADRTHAHLSSLRELLPLLA